MDEQSRLTYLTRYYFELQGLRFAPVWIALLFGVFALKRIPNNCDCLEWGILWYALGVLALMALWYLLARRYYRSRFGWLKPSVITLPKGPFFGILLLCLLGFMFYCIVIGSRAYEHVWIVFVLILPLLDSGNPRVRRIYYAVGGVLLAAAALLPEHSHQDVVRKGTIYGVVLCVVMLALGIADHMFLMSLRAPVREGLDG